MSPSDDPAGFWGSIGQLLSDTITMPILLIGGVFLMLVGLIIAGIYVWKSLQISSWLKVLLEVIFFLLGIDVCGNAYTIYDLSHTVQKISITVADQSHTVQKISITAADRSQTVQELSNKVAGLSQTVQKISGKVADLSQAVQKISKKVDSCCPNRCQAGTKPAPPVQSMGLSPAKATPEGWVYVGTNLGRHWDVKHFNWDSYNKRLPERDDVLTAAGLVNLRERFGEHAPIVDVICPDEQVQVLESKTLPNAYHWVKVKRIQEKPGSP